MNTTEQRTNQNGPTLNPNPEINSPSGYKSVYSSSLTLDERKESNAIGLGCLVAALKEISECKDLDKAQALATNAIEMAMSTYLGLANVDEIDQVLFVTTCMGVDPVNV